MPNAAELLKMGYLSEYREDPRSPGVLPEPQQLQFEKKYMFFSESILRSFVCYSCVP